MSDELRNDKNIRHFASRSQQPKVLAAGPGAKAAARGVSPVNVSIIFDQGFGSISDQIDDTRFSYIGSTPQLNKYETACNRHIKQGFMRDSFNC